MEAKPAGSIALSRKVIIDGDGNCVTKKVSANKFRQMMRRAEKEQEDRDKCEYQDEDGF